MNQVTQYKLAHDAGLSDPQLVSNQVTQYKLAHDAGLSDPQLVSRTQA